MKKALITAITALTLSLSMSAPVSAEEESPVSFSGVTIGVSCGGSVNTGEC